MNKNFLHIMFKLLIIAAALIIFGCGNKKPDKVRGQYEIWMQNLSFVPDSITVPAGTTVTWTNQDSVGHTVASSDTVNSNLLFTSGTIPYGGTFDFKFDSSGVYHYYCKIHAKKMNGVVVVQ